MLNKAFSLLDLLLSLLLVSMLLSATLRLAFTTINTQKEQLKNLEESQYIASCSEKLNIFNYSFRKCGKFQFELIKQ